MSRLLPVLNGTNVAAFRTYFSPLSGCGTTSLFMLSRRQLTSTAALVLLGAGGFFVVGNPSAFATAPNVVMFLADDMGWTDWQYDATLNPTGSKLYETPNLLRLAQRSVQFTQAYASAPVCSPTRASILTGQSPARTRLTNYLPGTANTTATLREP